MPSSMCVAVAASVAMLGCGVAHLAYAAQNIPPHITPFATVTVEHNSNVFMRPSDAPALAAQGITALSDTIQQYEGGVDAEFEWGPETLKLRGRGRRDIYHRFSFLDHTEYHVSGILGWQFGSVVNGTVLLKQSRVMAQFADTLSTQLLLNTERTALATVRVRVTPQWRIDLTPTYYELKTPLPQFPDFRLREDRAVAGLDYLGFGRLTAGLEFGYTQGRYAGIVGATQYDQRGANFTASYKVTGFSAFKGSVGYTWRDTRPNVVDAVPGSAVGAGVFAGYVGTIGKTSSATGSVSYSREITGKTSAYVSLYRRVESYAAGANPEIGTGGSLGVTWRVDPKFRVNLGYSLTQEKIQGGLLIAGVINREDRIQWARAAVRYAVLSWLRIQPFVIWEKETSTFRLGNYTATIAGLDITARF